jgi:SprT protein
VYIDPIDESRQAEVVALTRDYIRRAGEIYGQAFAVIAVCFDLSGRAAGMYRVRGGQREIRYNPYIFSKYFADNLANTVPHEVAHYITDMRYGLRNVRPHGREWREVMQAFAVEPGATSRYDLSGIPRRHRRQFSYRCACGTHTLGSVRHNRARSGQARYCCRRCGTVLSFAD